MCGRVIQYERSFENDRSEDDIYHQIIKVVFPFWGISKVVYQRFELTMKDVLLGLGHTNNLPLRGV
jgi:hypothetical protein